MSVGGRQYGVPYTFYQVGLYYRRDMLAAAGIAEPPRRWRDLLPACDKLRPAGIEPFAIGLATFGLRPRGSTISTFGITASCSTWP